MDEISAAGRSGGAASLAPCKDLGKVGHRESPAAGAGNPIDCPTAPVRIQRKRTAGWKMPPNTVYVGRVRAGDRGHGKWGNPCRVGMFSGYTAADAVQDYRRWLDRDYAVRSFENVFGKPPTCEEITAELRGKNLACWCPLDKPCHADVLLEIANK